VCTGVLESIVHLIDCQHFRSQAIFHAIRNNFGSAERFDGNIRDNVWNQVAIEFLPVYVTFIMIIHQRIARVHCCRQTSRVSSGAGSGAI